MAHTHDPSHSHGHDDHGHDHHDHDHHDHEHADKGTSHLDGEHEEEYKSVNYQDNPHLTGRQPVLAPGSVTETGEVVGGSAGSSVPGPSTLDDSGVNRQTLSGTVDNTQVRDKITGSAPAGVYDPNVNFRPVDYAGGATPQVVPGKDDLNEGGSASRRLDDGDGVVYPETRTPVAGQPSYERVHNDTSSPDYRDETYRDPGENVLDPKSGYEPVSNPKENTGY